MTDINKKLLIIAMCFIVGLVCFSSACKRQQNLLASQKAQNYERVVISSELPVAPENNNNGKVWKPAVFKGLKMGFNKREDAHKLFGHPASSTAYKYEIWDDYFNVDGYNGHIIVATSKSDNKLSMILWYPTDLSREESECIFGKNYKITKYAFVVGCPEDELDDGAPIYENPKGNIEFIEYRWQGIAISINESNQKVDEVAFLSKPNGFAKPRCR